MQTDAENRGDLQLPRNHVLQLPDTVSEVLETVQDFLACIEECPSFLRHGKILLSTLDQTDFETPLQGPDLLTHGTLRDRVETRRARKAAGFYEITKDLEGFNLHSKLPTA